LSIGIGLEENSTRPLRNDYNFSAESPQEREDCYQKPVEPQQRNHGRFAERVTPINSVRIGEKAGKPAQ
jgi:hypothetical protein